MFRQYQSVSAFSFWGLYPTTDRFRSVQWGDCPDNKGDNPDTSSQKSDPCNPENTVLQHADRCRKENGRLIFAELVDQCRFTNTLSAVDDNAPKLTTCVPFIQFPQLILTAIKLTHPLTCNNYTRKLLSYEYNYSDSLQCISRLCRVLPQLSVQVPQTDNCGRTLSSRYIHHARHTNQAGYPMLSDSLPNGFNFF